MLYDSVHSPMLQSNVTDIDLTKMLVWDAGEKQCGLQQLLLHAFLVFDVFNPALIC